MPFTRDVRILNIIMRGLYETAYCNIQSLIAHDDVCTVLARTHRGRYTRCQGRVLGVTTGRDLPWKTDFGRAADFSNFLFHRLSVSFFPISLILKCNRFSYKLLIYLRFIKFLGIAIFFSFFSPPLPQGVKFLNTALRAIRGLCKTSR